MTSFAVERRHFSHTSLVSLLAAATAPALKQVFHAGDAWWERPGAIHRISRNASATEPATLLAVYVAPRGAAVADLMKPI
jgi:hypothetical protein